MSATEELRRLLDERGVEWYEPTMKPNKTWFPDSNGINCCARPWSDKLEIKRHGLTPEQAITATMGTEINGETSDGYHTFNELYHHRAVLFSVVVAANSGRAWKSKLHHDGTMYDGMFIVGIDTPWGQASYHYDIDPYWDMFDCEEREAAPEWDGHTPDDAIERIGKLATLGDEWDDKPLSNMLNTSRKRFTAKRSRCSKDATSLTSRQSMRYAQPAKT